MTWRDFRDNALRMIDETGRCVIHVPGFSYTVGNSLKGMPELLVIGPFHPQVFGMVLNELSDAMVSSGVRPAGEVSLGGPKPVFVLEASEASKDEYTVQVGPILGVGDHEVLQVVFCDSNGRFPWDAGCAEPYASVPVMRRLQS